MPLIHPAKNFDLLVLHIPVLSQREPYQGQNTSPWAWHPEENSYINKMSLPRVRVWIRYRARAIAGVKGNFRHSHENNMGCRLCSQDSDETQEHLQLCEGTKFERRGLDLSDWRGLLDFWRRMKIKMAAVTWGPIDLKFSVVHSTHYISYQSCRY